MKHVNIANIRINGSTQSRAEINREVVADYAEAIKDGAEFPPVVVFFDGTAYWLADGFHRYEAHAEAGAHEIPADVRQGSQRDAILYSVGANAAHGLRRTNDDKRRAVMVLLGDPEWSKWSDREVARACGVTHPFVAKLRRPHPASKGGNRYHPEPEADASRLQGGAYQDPHPEAELDMPPRQDAAREDMLEAIAEDRARQTAEIEPPADPYGYAKLTEEALLDLANGLRADLDDEKKRRKEAERARDKLKADLAGVAGAGDQAEVIRRLNKKIEHLRSQMFKANEDARIAVRSRRKAEDARDEAVRKLGEQIIPLDYS